MAISDNTRFANQRRPSAETTTRAKRCAHSHKLKLHGPRPKITLPSYRWMMQRIERGDRPKATLPCYRWMMQRIERGDRPKNMIPSLASLRRNAARLTETEQAAAQLTRVGTDAEKSSAAENEEHPATEVALRVVKMLQSEKPKVEGQE